MKCWMIRILLCLILGAITTVAVAWGCAWGIDSAYVEAVDEEPIHYQRTLEETSSSVSGHEAMLLRSDAYAFGTRVRVFEALAIRHTLVDFLSDVAWHVSRDHPGAAARGQFLQRFASDAEIVWFLSQSEQMRAQLRQAVTSVPHESAECATIISAAKDLLRRYDAATITPDEATRAVQADTSVGTLGTYVDAGWPLLGLRGADFVKMFDNRVAEGWTFGILPLSERFVPFHPSWPGFAIDTLFYAAIWGGVFFGFTSAKRFIHSKRGRCPRCGYDLRGQRFAASGKRPAVSARGCPECGWNRAESDSSRRDDGM